MLVDDEQIDVLPLEVSDNEEGDSDNDDDGEDGSDLSDDSRDGEDDEDIGHAGVADGETSYEPVEQSDMKRTVAISEVVKANPDIFCTEDPEEQDWEFSEWNLFDIPFEEL